MEDDTIRCAATSQNVEHVFVRVAIVDHQRLARPLGDLDVRAEPVPLQPWRRAVAIVIKAGLADRPDLRQRCEPRDLVECRIPGGLGSGGLVRVDRHRGVHVSVLGGASRRPLGRLDIAADSDHADNARRAGGSQHRLDRPGQHVQVRVRIKYEPRERVRCRGHWGIHDRGH